MIFIQAAECIYGPSRRNKYSDVNMVRRHLPLIHRQSLGSPFGDATAPFFCSHVAVSGIEEVQRKHTPKYTLDDDNIHAFAIEEAGLIRFLTPISLKSWTITSILLIKALLQL